MKEKIIVIITLLSWIIIIIYVCFLLSSWILTILQLTFNNLYFATKQIICTQIYSTTTFNKCVEFFDRFI